MNDRALSLSSPRATARRWIGGACVALFLGALALLAVWSGGWLQDRAEFSVRFTATTGLSKSSPVLLLGQPIGRVQELHVGADGGQPVVDVRFWIEAAHLEWVREGAVVTERSGFVGSPWLDLQPGSPDRPRLAAGSRVPSAVETSLVERILAIQPFVENLIQEVDTLVGTLNETVKRIDPILAKVEAQLGTTQQALTEVTQLIGNTEAMFVQLEKDQAVLVDGVVATLARLNDEVLPGVERMIADSRGEIVGTFGELDETLAIVQTRLPDVFTALQETLDNTRAITESTRHTWPFNRYWKKLAKQEAAAAKKEAKEAARKKSE